MDKTLYIIDGNALLYRAYYAFISRPLVTTKGENTSALFGFMRMLVKLIQDYQPQYLLCAFDSKGKTFRHERFAEYKAKRMQAPEDLKKQGETIRALLDNLGVPRLEIEGFEADDIIGTIIRRAKEHGIQTVVVSGDKDILQLVDPQVKVFTSKKGVSDIEELDSKKVEELWGVPPERIVDLLALMGDQSDNVPGVKGIGKSFAVELISKFGTIENLFSNLDKVEKERVRNLLKEGKESAELSKDLVTIRTDAPLEFSLENYRLKDFPKNEGVTLLIEKELNMVVSELEKIARDKTQFKRLKEEAKAVETKRGSYHLVKTIDEYRELERRVREKGVISLDTETTSMDPVIAELIGVSISVEEGEGYYIPIVRKDGNAFGIDFLKTELRKILEDGSIEKKGQNIKYDFVVLLKYGVHIEGITGDSMIAAYLLSPQKQRYNMDDLAQEYLDYRTIRYTDVVKKKDETLLDYPIDAVVEYSGEDSDITLRLIHVLEKKLHEEGLFPLYRDIEVPLLIVLGKMENNGVRIDPEYLIRMSGSFAEEISMVEERIFELAGERFNVRSTRQLSSILFDKLKLPVMKSTKTGLSTDESVLEELAQDYEIAQLILRHRMLAKLKSGYIDALPALINPGTGRIHTSFNQTVAATGRLSSNTPNLQNIPIREKEGKAIRRAFIPEDGWGFVSADYSQIELRILASLSGDSSLMQAFRNDRDIHRETASQLFGVKPEEVTELQRQMAKTINFSIIYGISPFGLSKRLRISRTDAANFIEMYFKKYSGVKAFFDNLVEDVKKKGCVETLLGRKRYIPEINSANQNIFEAAKRVAINTPIQGSAADLIKKAMVEIDRDMTRRKMSSRMLIQVHDELVFESPPEEVEELKKVVKETMEHALEFQVPLKVNISEGKNWEEAH
ncbi:MAG: DNA polymerase I [Spirochaetota bacterium]